MGRPKKEVRSATSEAKEYVLFSLKNIHKINAYCEKVERCRPVMLQRGNIDPANINADALITTALFAEPKAAEYDQKEMEQYLTEKERQYLLQKGMQVLETEAQEFVEDMFVKKMSRSELIGKWHLSQATLTRYRNSVVNQMALFIDEYMNWKVETLFM